MKTKSILGLILIATLVLTSCKKELSANNNEVEKSTLTTSSDSIPVSETTPAQVDLSKTEEVKLNPAHGQPGHRCDIAVGAPLNAPVKPSTFYQEPVIPKATPSAPASSPVVNSVATPVNPNTPRPKLNPAHGQPHHDCKIQVGDPLPDA